MQSIGRYFNSLLREIPPLKPKETKELVSSFSNQLKKILGAKEMSNRKQQKTKTLMSTLIALSLIFVSIQLSAISIETEQNESMSSTITVSNHESRFTPCASYSLIKDYNQEPQIIPISSPSSQSFSQSLAGDIPVIVLQDDIDVQNPSLFDNGANTIVMAAEGWEDMFTSNIYLRYSTDGGSSWVPEDSVLSWALPDNELLQSKPAIDFSGDNGGFGAMTPIDPPSFITLTFDDINDHEAGEGWLINPWDTDSRMEEIDSADAAGVPSQYAPDPSATGVTVRTGTEIAGVTNVMWISWHVDGGDGLRNLWTGSGDLLYEWSDAKCDVDLSTGMYFDASYMYDDVSEEPNPDGVSVEWCQLDGTDTWWESDWGGFHIPGAMNQDIKAEGGKCYVVYELDGSIECTYSTGDLDTWNTVTIANDGSFPSITAVGDTIVCSYTRDANLYSAISEDGGATWIETLKVNDEEDTVVSQSHCTDVSGMYVTWTDNREGTNGVYLDQAEIAIPIIEIESVGGGFGAKATVVNTGTADATDIDWSITLEGGAFIGGETSGTIQSLSVGESVAVKTGFILGFGATEITLTVGGATQKASGTVLLFFILGV